MQSRWKTRKQSNILYSCFTNGDPAYELCENINCFYGGCAVFSDNAVCNANCDRRCIKGQFKACGSATEDGCILNSYGNAMRYGEYACSLLYFTTGFYVMIGCLVVLAAAIATAVLVYVHHLRAKTCSRRESPVRVADEVLRQNERVFSGGGQIPLQQEV